MFRISSHPAVPPLRPFSSCAGAWPNFSTPFFAAFYQCFWVCGILSFCYFFFRVAFAVATDARGQTGYNPIMIISALDHIGYSIFRDLALSIPLPHPPTELENPIPLSRGYSTGGSRLYIVFYFLLFIPHCTVYFGEGGSRAFLLSPFTLFLSRYLSVLLFSVFEPIACPQFFPLLSSFLEYLHSPP